MGAAARDAGTASLLLCFEDCFGLIPWRSAGLSSLTKPGKSWSLIGFFHLCACWWDQFPSLAGCRSPSAGMMQGVGQWLKQHGAFWSQCKFISINEAGLNQLRSQSLQEVYTGGWPLLHLTLFWCQDVPWVFQGEAVHEVSFFAHRVPSCGLFCM